MLRKLWNVLLIVATAVLALQGGAQGAQPTAFHAAVTLQGRFSMVWGDGAPGTGTSLVRYYLTLADGQVAPLQVEADAWPEGGLLALNRQAVVVRGNWELLEGNVTLVVDSIELAQQAEPEDIIGPQPWVSIMCKFSDYAVEPKDMAYFMGMYANTYPGLDHFWRQQSYDVANLEGSGAFGWYVLPYPREHYVPPGGDLDWGAAAADCTGVADADVNFHDYVGINLMFNAVLDCCAWGGSWTLCLDGLPCQQWRVTWEPPWGYENIGVIGHETGHGFGLPHSSGDYGETYDNQWDVMSDVWSNESRGGSDPVYGTMGQHTISFHKGMLGWIPGAQLVQVNTGNIRTLTLERLGVPQTSNTLGVVIPINGASDHFYTVEARQNTPTAGYDDWLPGTAVIIHEVLLGRDNPAHVIDIDGNGNTGDEGAMWRVGETFVDLDSRIFVEVLSATASGFVVRVENRFIRLSQVNISGPQRGAVGEPIDLTADVLPVNVTPPITYTWEASGQAPVTHTGGIQDSLSYTWMAPGTQVVTVTASNADSSMSETYAVDVILPITEVALDGPAAGLVGVTTTLTATVGPLDASEPVEYVWQAAGQAPVVHSGALSDTASFAWTEPGTAVVTVTASNLNDTFQAVHSWPVYRPLEAVQLDGPAQGVVQQVYTFTAAVSPSDVTQPLTYTWQVDGQAPLTHTGGVSDSVGFAWAEGGVYTLALSVENAAGTLTYAQAVAIAAPPQVQLAGPERGFVGMADEFVATVQLTATLPVTYVWLVDGQAVLTQTGGLSDTLSLTWADHGPHTVRVEATNAGGTSAQEWEVVVYTRTFLPLISSR